MCEIAEHWHRTESDLQSVHGFQVLRLHPHYWTATTLCQIARHTTANPGPPPLPTGTTWWWWWWWWSLSAGLESWCRSVIIIYRRLDTETSPAPVWLGWGKLKYSLLQTTGLSVSQVHFASFSWQITILTPPHSTGPLALGLNNTEYNLTMWRLRRNFLPLIPIFSCISTTFTQLFQSSHFGSGRGLELLVSVWAVRCVGGKPGQLSG